MSDNVVLNPGSGGATIATDEVGGSQHQYVKVEFGADGVATPVSSENPLPVILSGAATAARQDTGNTSLASIDTKLTSLTIQDGGSSLTIDGKVSDTPESYTAGDYKPLSLTPEGRLRVSVVDANTEFEFFPKVDFSTNIYTAQNNPYNF